ncbi:MAG: SEC-C metal-binding domain-containing protein [Desulfosalsimonadaceae bacterium]
MKIGRNDPCPCGSGKKYKKCCLGKQELEATNVVQSDFGRQKLRRTEGELIARLKDYARELFGEGWIEEAWDEFVLWGEVEIEEDWMPEIIPAFEPWLVFAWDAAEMLEDPDLPDDAVVPEKSVARFYAEAHPDALDDFQKRYIAEISAQPYSFFQVIDVKPGKELTLKDLLLERTVTVQENQAATQEVKAKILFTRVIAMDDVSVMVGAYPLMIPPDYHGYFIDFRQAIMEAQGEVTAEILRDYDLEMEMRGIFFRIFEKAMNPEPPVMQNTDGDPLAPVKLIYELTCSPLEAFRALKILAWGADDEELLSEAEYDDTGEMVRIHFSWMKKGNQKHPEWSNTVMGRIGIDKDRLTVEVNSENRSKTIQKEVKKRLKNKAVYKNTVMTSVEKMLEEQGQGEFMGAGPGPGGQALSQEEMMQIPELKEQMAEMAEKHWEHWMDTPLPALGDLTPRQAADDPIGREKLAGLFLSWEAMASKSTDNLFSPDIGKLKQKLGL